MLMLKLQHLVSASYINYLIKDKNVKICFKPHIAVGRSSSLKLFFKAVFMLQLYIFLKPVARLQ